MARLTKKALQERADRIGLQLDTLYPEPPIPLDHSDPFTLLCAVLLSAQSTDKKVNQITPALFERAPTPQAMAALEVSEILSLIREIGLAPTKAKHLKAMAEQLVSAHQGMVPASFPALEALPGVGHKTASVVMSQAFGVPAFAVDTHIHRLAARWSLSDGTTVQQTEADLKLLFPRDTWNRRHLQIIYFGREYCPALRHQPESCPICSWTGCVEPKPLKAPRSASSAKGAAAKVGKAAPNAKAAATKVSKPKA